MKHLFFLLFLVSSLAYGQKPARGTLMPVGAIMAFGGANCPDGWLAADGVAKATATYPQLDAYFGTTWGARSGGNFQIPDLNSAGRYLRGGNSVGTLQAQATAKNGLTVSSSAASSSISGTAATGVNLTHNHDFGTDLDGASGTVRRIPGAAQPGTGGYINTRNSGTLDHSHSVSGTAAAQVITTTLGAGDSETRPITAVVKYCIKY